MHRRRRMQTLRVGLALLVAALLAACTQTATPSGSPSAAATGAASPSAGAPSKPVELRVIVPASGARVGEKGVGWSVDVLARANDGSVLGDFRPGLVTTPRVGHSANFPGLVVLLSSATSTGQTTASASPSAAASASASAARSASALPAASGSPAAGGAPNLAGLFQLFAITDAQAANAAARASATPSASASATASAARAPSVSSGPREVEATWLVNDARFGADVDVELTVFVVEGNAPDAVGDRSSLRIVSNEVTVRFHINNGASGGASPAPSASATAAATASASGSASASPSPSPSKSP